MHWQHRLFLTFESPTLHLFFSLQCKTMLFTNKKHEVTSSERAHSILRDTNKKGVEIGERQNRCHDDIRNVTSALSCCFPFFPDSLHFEP